MAWAASTGCGLQYSRMHFVNYIMGGDLCGGKRPGGLAIHLSGHLF